MSAASRATMLFVLLVVLPQRTAPAIPDNSDDSDYQTGSDDVSVFMR